MNNENLGAYTINNEYDLLELIQRFDSNYIFSVINDKLKDINYAAILQEPNLIDAFENNFKIMREQYTGDSANIASIREQIYRQIIEILTNRFNLQFNMVDDTIDIYTAAKYIYDFLICRRSEVLTTFLASFIINNKDFLYNQLVSTIDRRNKGGSSKYASMNFTDEKFILIASNINKVLNILGEMDIRLVNIFQSIYVDHVLVAFLDNAFADKGNFFKSTYMAEIMNPEVGPIIITNVKLMLQRLVGNITNNIEDFIKQ